MARLIKRTVVLALVWFGALVSGRTSAQTGAPTLSASDFSFYVLYFDSSQQLWVQMTPTQQQYSLSRARCECVADTSSWTGFVKIAIQPAATTSDKIRALLNQSGLGSGFAALYAGTNAYDCLSPPAVANAAPAFCVNLLDPSNYATGITGGMAMIAANRVWMSDPIPVARLFGAAETPVCGAGSCDDVGSCAAKPAKINVYFWAQTSNGKTADMLDSMFTLELSGEGPTAPTKVAVDAASQALDVSWGWPGTLSPAATTSFLGVQLFCQRAPDLPVFKFGTFTPAFMTSWSLCPDVAPAPPANLAFGNLDPAFLCSGLLPATTTSYRINGLQNGVDYAVGVVAIDKLGNASAIQTTDVVHGSAQGPDGGAAGATFPGGCGCGLGGRSRGATVASLGLVALAMVGARRRWGRRTP